MKIFIITLPIIFIAASGLASFAQTPVQIDVKSMEISKVGSAGPTSFRMEAINSAQNTIVYQGVDSGALGVMPFSLACPCSPPKRLETNIFPSEMIADLGTNTGQVRFYIASSTSSPIILNQRVLSKKKDFFVNGATRVEGRIEVRNGSGIIIAFDNDVILQGGYSVVYGKPYVLDYSGKRTTDFRSVVYSLNAQ